MPLPRLRSQQFCPGRTCRQDAANYRRQTERFAARNGGASYDLYLAMRAVGVCNVCGKQHDNPTGLHSHCYGGQVLGVKCSDHNVDFAQVRRGMASPIGAMAEYLKAVFS